MRPLIALDVDGVLNADAFSENHQITVPAAELPRSPFIRGGGETDLHTLVRLNPAHRDWLRELAAVGDLVWATTWEHTANAHLAPLLGLDELPVAVSTSRTKPRFRASTADWKAAALEDYAQGRALIWIDDMAYGYMQFWDRGESSATLVLAPDERTGMNREHVQTMLAFAAHAADEQIKTSISIDSMVAVGDHQWLTKLGVSTPFDSDERMKFLLPRPLVGAVHQRLSEAVDAPERWPGMRAQVIKDVAAMAALL